PNHNDWDFALRDIRLAKETDRAYACESLCFDGAKASQCVCAKCLETDVCDPRCANLSPCFFGDNKSCGWEYEEQNPLSGYIKGKKCGGLAGDWVLHGETSITASGMTIINTNTRTVTIDQTLRGPFQYDELQKGAGTLVTARGSGTAKIAPQRDGSVVM